MYEFVGYERTCALCGKKFVTLQVDWGYKRRAGNDRLYFCRYSHMREYDKKREHIRKLERELDDCLNEKADVKERYRHAKRPESLEKMRKQLDELNNRIEEITKEIENAESVAADDTGRKG